MPQRTAPIIDAGGNRRRMKMRKIREYEQAGEGAMRSDGVFVFHPLPQECKRTAVSWELPTRQEPSFTDRLSKLPSWPQGDRYTGGVRIEGFLSYPQPSMLSAGPRYRGLSRQGAGL